MLDKINYRIKNYYIALLFGLSCHLLILGFNRSIGERIVIPFIRTGLYGFGMVFLGIGPFIHNAERILLRNLGMAIVCAILLIFALSASLPIAVLNWDTLYSYLANKQAHGPLINLDGTISIITLIISGAIFALLLGNRFANLLKNSENPILILATYSTGFLLAALLAFMLIPKFGPAVLLILSILFFLSCLWLETRKIQPIFGIALTILVFLAFSCKDFSKISAIGCKDPERILTTWSPYNRLDFIRSVDDFKNEWLIANYNFYPVWITSKDANIEKQIRQFPIGEIDREEKILIIGAGGGFSLRMFLMKNPKADIVVNEIDPEVIRLMRGRLSKYNDGAYNDPRVEVLAGDGSLVLERLVREKNYRFDKIIYDGTDSQYLALSHSLAPVDCYLYTREAFENVSRLLKPKGIFLNYMTAIGMKNISYMLPSMNSLFYFQLAFTRLSASFPSKGHPYCFMVAAKNKERLAEYLNNIQDSGRYNFVSTTGDNIPKEVLTYDKPALAPKFVKTFLLILVLLSCVVSSFFLNSTRKSTGWQMAISSFLLGIGYIFVELLVLDRVSRYFTDLAIGQSLCISLFLFGQIPAIYLMSRGSKSKSIILIPCLIIGILLFIPTALSYPIFTSSLLGFACGICFPYIIRNFEADSLGKLYGLDTIGSIVGLFVYFLTIFTWGFQSATIIAVSLYTVVALISFLLYKPHFRY